MLIGFIALARCGDAQRERSRRDVRKRGLNTSVFAGVVGLFAVRPRIQHDGLGIGEKPPALVGDREVEAQGTPRIAQAHLSFVRIILLARGDVDALVVLLETRLRDRDTKREREHRGRVDKRIHDVEAPVAVPPRAAVGPRPVDVRRGSRDRAARRIQDRQADANLARGKRRTLLVHGDRAPTQAPVRIRPELGDAITLVLRRGGRKRDARIARKGCAKPVRARVLFDREQARLYLYTARAPDDGQVDGRGRQHKI